MNKVMSNTVEFTYSSKTKGDIVWIIESSNETKELYDDLNQVFSSYPEGEHDGAIRDFNDVFLKHGGAMKLVY